MATTTNITTTYAGQFAGKYIAAALLSGNTLDKGGIEIKPNIKYQEIIKKVATDSNIIKDGTCDFTATGTVTLTERIILPEEFQVNLQLCKKDFRSDWEAVQMGYSVYDNLPPKFSDFLIGHVSGLVAENTENNIWKGVTGNAGEFDGFVTLATADATVIDVAKIAAGVDAANVVEQLGRIVDAIPAALALAQAANESIWGTSRFTVKVNNYFGLWCWSNNCGLVPNKQSQEKSHEVSRFNAPVDGVKYYMQTLNSHPAYKKLRDLRFAARDQKHPNHREATCQRAACLL